jgi:hypothetical protein
MQIYEAMDVLLHHSAPATSDLNVKYESLDLMGLYGLLQG